MAKRVTAIKSKGKEKRELDDKLRLIDTFYRANTRILSGYDRSVEEEYASAQEYIVSKTNALKKEIKTYVKLGYTENDALERVMPKAYGLVKAVSGYYWGKAHFDSQLTGAIFMNHGYASEMATGEGKTLTAVLPAYLNALVGKGVHVITPNGYLAKRDYEEMKPLYELLGLSVGLAEEQRNPSPEEVEKETRAILEKKASVGNIIPGNKLSDEMFENLKTAFDNSLYREARSEAFEILKKRAKDNRKKAYSADITYGSSAAIAFDYLYDDIEQTRDGQVQRDGKTYLAILDEADQVLVDDAVTPFSLSGTSQDEKLSITEEEKREKDKIFETVDRAVYKIVLEDKLLQERNRGTEKSKERLIVVFEDKDYELITKDKSPQAQFYDMTKAILINKKTKQVHLTTLGETILYTYYKQSEINQILKDNLENIREMKFNGGPLFTEGYDYLIDDSGNIKMEPRAFAYLATSGRIPELERSFRHFATTEYIDDLQAIDNSLKAYFGLKENEDYKLSVPSKPKSSTERAVSLVMNGRTAEGRVYSNGLQQAIELKEKRLHPEFDIKHTEIKTTLASIPTNSFFSARYEFVSAMTGTAAINAFKELYGLETYEVPRNKPKQVIDHGDRLYPDTQSKNEAIYQEVKSSIIKGQPVLLSTTSIAESEKLGAYLERRFREESITHKDISILNANVDNLEDEAKIVAKAGTAGAITISTEMAGRGTDIKLGGDVEVPELADVMKIVKEEKVNEMIGMLQKQGKVTPENEEARRKQLTALLEKKPADVEKEARRRIDRIKETKKAEEERVLEAGGLKVIGSGHFQYSRVDGQVKGRCGRQGNKGEVVFFNTPEDLAKVRVKPEIVAELARQAEIAPIIEDPTTGKTPIGDAIYDAQERYEEEIKESIRQNGSIETTVNKYRKWLRTQKDELKENDDYIDAVDYMIECSVEDIIAATSDIGTMRLKGSMKLSRVGLDAEELMSLSSEFLGVELTEKEIRGCKTVKDLGMMMIERTEELHKQREEEIGHDAYEAECKDVVDRYMSRVWYGFEIYEESIKRQNELTQITTQQKTDPMLIESRLGIAFRHCVESERAQIVRELINPEYKSKVAEPREELVTMRVTTNGIEVVDRDYDKRFQQEVDDMVERESENQMRMSNFEPKPALFVTSNQYVINRKYSDLGKRTIVESEIEEVDFGEQSYGRGGKK